MSRLASDAAEPLPRVELPQWVDRLGAGVWISSPDRLVVHVNDRALEMLGVAADEVLGEPCHRMVAGRDESGETFCRGRCSLVEQARRGEPLSPMILRVGPEGAERCLQVVIIPLQVPAREGDWLLHCATDVGRAKRAEGYLEGLAARSSEPAGRERLTPREREVLALLAGGATPEDVARQLHVSLTTVRNHVQHVLGKLGAHSVQEAIAHYLLGD